VQWQILTWAGSISASKLIEPQWQPPVTFIPISPDDLRPMPGRDGQHLLFGRFEQGRITPHGVVTEMGEREG
jgi:hypothetical protein